MSASSLTPSAEEGVPVWAEVHFDDEVISAHPDRWPEARALLLCLVDLAASRGARLSLRFRAPLARLAAQHAPDLLPDLLRRGHEVGAHAHGRGLADVIEALRSAGVVATVAAPGLVQAGPGGRTLLLQQAAALGITTVTDHAATRGWAYEGLHPRREAGVWVLAPTVRPFDWGLMSTDGTRHGLGPAPIARLRALRDAAPRHGAAWFGFTFHEHDLCPPGSLQPRPAALDALAAVLDARVVPAASLSPVSAAPPPAGAVVAARGPSDRQVRMARVFHAVAQHLPSRPHRPAVLRRPPPPQGRAVLAAPGGRHITAERLGPAQPRALLVVSHAGQEGGRRLRFRPFGPVQEALIQQGWGIWLYDRAGTGDSLLPPSAAQRHPLTPGSPLHTADWQVVLARARGEGVPVVALSWSSGVLPPLRAAAAGGLRPDALIDAEGPADRWSLVPPGGNELSAWDPWDDAPWVGREPVALLPALGCPYVRLQGTLDHVHGELDLHAARMEAAAQAAGLRLGPVQRHEGRLHAHPEALLEAVDRALGAAMRRR